MPTRSACPLAFLIPVILAIACPAAAQPLSFRRAGSVIPPEAAGRIEFGDLDADGDDDILSVPGGVFLNDGSGSLEPHPTPSPALAGYFLPHSDRVILADVDGDGDDDAFFLPVQSTTGPALWLNGGGVFHDATFQLPALPQTSYWWNANPKWESAASADFDADGDLDLFLAPIRLILGGHVYYYTQTTPILWLNIGSGYFVDASSQLPGTSICAGSVLARDWDGDGDIDIRVTRHESYSSFSPPLPVSDLFLNSGTATFTVAANAPAVSLAPSTAFAGDLDGDGFEDLVGMTWNSVVLNRGLPGGQIGSGVQIPLPAPGAVLALRDMDGDGRAEVIAGVEGAIVVLALDPTGTAWAAAQTLPLACGAWFRRIVPGDLDDDGDDELVAESTIGKVPMLLDSLGMLAIVHDGPLTEGLGAVRCVADLELDGDPDVVSQIQSRLVASMNDGIGRFVPGPPIAAATSPYYAPVVVHPFDDDGDGDLDLYVGNSIIQPQQERILRNDGAAGWTPAQAFASSFWSRDVDEGDLDDDGDVDLVLSDSGGTWILPGTGPGSFGPRFLLVKPAAPSAQFHLADLDDDGDLDGVALEDAGTCRILMNLGGLAFAPAVVPGVLATGAAVGDVDGDGDPDIVLQDRWLRNLGGGAFAPAGPPVTPTWTFMTPVLADFDGDGDQDFVAPLVNGPLAIWANDGLGGFSLAYTFGWASQIVLNWNSGYPLVVADLDRDGDPDVVDPSLAIWHNQRVHVSAGGVPVPGGRVRMKVRGPPQSSFLLMASPGRADIDLPPFGRILIDPALAVPVVSGILDQGGASDFSLDIPSATSLIGLAVWWQAWLPAAGRVTNAAGTTVQDG